LVVEEVLDVVGDDVVVGGFCESSDDSGVIHVSANENLAERGNELQWFFKLEVVFIEGKV
jgi:hypothetical protein